MGGAGGVPDTAPKTGNTWVAWLKDMSCARLAPHFWSSGDGTRNSPVEGVVPFKQFLST